LVSKTRVTVRSSGVVVISVRVEATYVLVDVFPLIFVCSVMEARLNGLLGLDKVTLRVRVTSRVFRGVPVFVMTEDAMGVCSPKRGSADCVRVTTVPSGFEML
jgi:hypothetical protein